MGLPGGRKIADKAHQRPFPTGLEGGGEALGAKFDQDGTQPLHVGAPGQPFHQLRPDMAPQRPVNDPLRGFGVVIFPAADLARRPG